ncbi:MAG: GWxTD domain-containing protein [bacterium]
MASENFELSRLDIYIRITYDELQFIKTEDASFRADYEVTIDIFDSKGKSIDGKNLQDNVITADIGEINSPLKSSMNKVSFDLAPGKYQIVLELQDLETLKSTHQEQSVELRKFSSVEISASDILYLDYLTKFDSGDFKFSPKVSGIKHEDSKLFAYFEIYNVPKSDSIHVQYDIVNQEDKVVETSEFWRESQGAITKNFMEIASDNLPHGKYLTKIKVTNHDQVSEVERAFTWHWEALPESMNDLDEAIESLIYIATEKEISKLKKKTQAEKHAAFIEFWKKYDPTPGTTENELRQEYYKRIKYAKDNFYGMRRAGWKTDMGWVYVKLGEPDTIDRNPYNQGSVSFSGRTIKAVEIWNYYKYNRRLIFIDEIGFGEYRLENPDVLYEIIK